MWNKISTHWLFWFVSPFVLAGLICKYSAGLAWSTAFYIQVPEIASPGFVLLFRVIVSGVVFVLALTITTQELEISKHKEYLEKLEDQDTKHE